MTEINLGTATEEIKLTLPYELIFTLGRRNGFVNLLNMEPDEGNEGKKRLEKKMMYRTQNKCNLD